MAKSLARRVTGKDLARAWKVRVKHALYHKDGSWYNNLTEFPGALFDPTGYVVFHDKGEYERCPQISIGDETNVRGSIRAIPGYVWVNTPREQ